MCVMKTNTHKVNNPFESIHIRSIFFVPATCWASCGVIGVRVDKTHELWTCCDGLMGNQEGPSEPRRAWKEGRGECIEEEDGGGARGSQAASSGGKQDRQQDWSPG